MAHADGTCEKTRDLDLPEDTPTDHWAVLKEKCREGIRIPPSEVMLLVIHIEELERRYRNLLHKHNKVTGGNEINTQGGW